MTSAARGGHPRPGHGTLEQNIPDRGREGAPLFTSMPQALLLSTVLQNLLTSDSQVSRFQSSTQSQGPDDNRPHIISLPLLSPQTEPPIQRFLFSFLQNKSIWHISGQQRSGRTLVGVPPALILSALRLSNSQMPCCIPTKMLFTHFTDRDTEAQREEAGPKILN